ncbi:MAG: HTH domain-containing protein [Kiritimatiellae bacterium]|nr:HTH domain-containing protein [Kiritimatiellia bacterium]
MNEDERKFLPLEMKGVADDETLWTWLSRRTVPRNRRNIEELMARFGLNSHNIRGIIELCRGLSLNDVHWVVDDNFKGTWAEYNLYSNPFSKAVSIRKFVSRVNPALYVKWLGFPGGITSEMTARLSALKGFRIKRHPKYNLSSRRISAIEDFIQKRIREISEYGCRADELLSISGKQCTVNNTNGMGECTVKSDSIGIQIKQSMNADPFITKMELAEILQVSPRWIARKIKELQESGEIRRIGADKNGHWEVCRAK